MAESITEGTLSTIHKQIGDHIEVDEELASIETDKIDVSVNAPESGVLTKLLVATGDTVVVGQSIAQIDTTVEAAVKESEDVASDAHLSTMPGDLPERGQTPPSTTRFSSEEDVQPTIQDGSNTPIPSTNASTAIERSPQTQPWSSTPDVRPTEADANIFLFRDERVEQLPRMRKTIAQRLKSSQSTNVTLTTMQEIDMSALIHWRKENKDRVLEEHNVRLGYMGAFVRAATIGAQRVPSINAAIDLDNEEITFRDYVDISVAVSTPKGLVTPVLRNCESLNIVTIEKKVRHLAEKARDGELIMDDLRGGNFSISNPGIFGSMFGTPVINYQQSAVFNMNTIYDRVVAIDGTPEIRPIMYITLSYDHRLIEDREAIAFLNIIKDCIEKPSRMLLALTIQHPGGNCR